MTKRVWWLICRLCKWAIRVPVPDHGWSQERPKLPEWAKAEYREHWYEQHGYAKEGTTRQKRRDQG